MIIKIKKIFTKKKTDNITNKSKHIDLISNNDKDCSMTKYSSSIFNKSNIYSQGNGNISINNLLLLIKTKNHFFS